LATRYPLHTELVAIAALGGALGGLVLHTDGELGFGSCEDGEGAEDREEEGSEVVHGAECSVVVETFTLLRPKHEQRRCIT
jgi:hypothetical protein